jgi:hypothetical protein
MRCIMKTILLLVVSSLVVALPARSQSTNRILFEGCTGTWCGYCPCGHEILEGILQSNPSMLVLLYHGGGGGDPWLIFNGNEIISLLGYTAYPRAAIGRREGNLNRAYWVGAVNNQVSLDPPISLSFTNNYDPTTRQLVVQASATAERDIDTTTMISLILTESNLVFNQSSYSGCPPGGPNYVHKHVVRSMVNGALGDTLTTGKWVQGFTRTKSFITTIDPGWNTANLEIGVFVYFSIPGAILNSQCPVLQTAKSSVVSSVENCGEIVDGFHLLQNYPNPFNQTTNIKFSVAAAAHASLKVFDALGKEVVTLCDARLEAGAYNAGFDGSNLAGGVYFYQIRAGGFVDVKKLVLIK